MKKYGSYLTAVAAVLDQCNPPEDVSSGVETIEAYLEETRNEAWLRKGKVRIRDKVKVFEGEFIQYLLLERENNGRYSVCSYKEGVDDMPSYRCPGKLIPDEVDHPFNLTWRANVCAWNEENWMEMKFRRVFPDMENSK